MTRRQQPTPLGEALQKYLQESGLEERLEAAGVVPEWAARVGPARERRVDCIGHSHVTRWR